MRAAVALALLVLAGACGPAAHPPEGRPLVSLLAVGDTGSEPLRLRVGDRQLAVGEALAAEDRRAPAAALLLLGDNFYPEGLLGGELVARVRRNVVRPYCRFADLSGPRSAAVADSCDVPASLRRPEVPIYAILGNHDYNRPESPGLQREAVPRFVANWRVPAGRAETVELGHGVSLVLFDSMALYGSGAGGDDLRRALRSARGPWRILAGHHPVAAFDGDRLETRYREAVARAIAEEERPVHVFLAGHEHNLQIVELEPPLPRLLAVAGSGSDVRPSQRQPPGHRFGADAHGFARVDLVLRDGEERLAVSLFQVPALPLAGPRRLGVWSVDAGGRLRDER